MEKLPKQMRFRPALPQVVGNKDYDQEKDLLVRIDEILRLSGIDEAFVESSLIKWKSEWEGDPLSAELERRRRELSSVGMRSLILMDLLGESYRKLSRRLAQCPLFQWFCGLDELGVVRVPSKSALHRIHSWIDARTLKELSCELVRKATRSAQEGQAQALNLKNALELDTVWMDSTAVKAKIHYRRIGCC